MNHWIHQTVTELTCYYHYFHWRKLYTSLILCFRTFLTELLIWNKVCLDCTNFFCFVTLNMWSWGTLLRIHLLKTLQYKINVAIFHSAGIAINLRALTITFQGEIEWKVFSHRTLTIQRAIRRWKQAPLTIRYSFRISGECHFSSPFSELWKALECMPSTGDWERNWAACWVTFSFAGEVHGRSW